MRARQRSTEWKVDYWEMPGKGGSLDRRSAFIGEGGGKRSDVLIPSSIRRKWGAEEKYTIGKGCVESSALVKHRGY